MRLGMMRGSKALIDRYAALLASHGINAAKAPRPAPEPRAAARDMSKA
jgi:hypothetical protein